MGCVGLLSMVCAGLLAVDCEGLLTMVCMAMRHAGLQQVIDYWTPSIFRCASAEAVQLWKWV